jgi:RimK family alpha-L-glutamate ligase
MKRLRTSHPASAAAPDIVKGGPRGKETGLPWRRGPGRLVLVAGHFTETNAMLLEAFARRGIAAHWLRPADALATMGCGDMVLGRLDVDPAMNGVEPGLRELDWCCRQGLVVLNRPVALSAAHDKLVTAQRLADAGIPHPQTAHFHENEPPDMDPPVVVKPRFGRWGRQVTLCKTERELRDCSRRLRQCPWFVRHGALVQEFVPPLGHELRLVVAGGRVVGAVERIAAPGEWRTTVFRGARQRPTDLDPEAVAIAVTAAAAVDTDLVGVDLLPLPNGSWTALELNGAVDLTPDHSLPGKNVFAAAVAALLPS